MGKVDLSVAPSKLRTRKLKIKKTAFIYKIIKRTGFRSIMKKRGFPMLLSTSDRVEITSKEPREIKKGNMIKRTVEAFLFIKHLRVVNSVQDPSLIRRSNKKMKDKTRSHHWSGTTNRSLPEDKNFPRETTGGYSSPNP